MTPIHPVHLPSYWDQRYHMNDAGWDMKTPTPVFVELLDSGRYAPGAALVLGCGKGYDAVLFAQHGFDVTAVDFSEAALDHTMKLAAESGTTLSVARRDLFSLSPELDCRFDYVVEYVTFCAIDPRRREEFAGVVSSVLKPGGRLLGLFFPIDERAGGPPFSVTRDEVEELFSRTCDLEFSQIPAGSVKPRQGKEILTVWRKRSPVASI